MFSRKKNTKYFSKHHNILSHFNFLFSKWQKSFCKCLIIIESKYEISRCLYFLNPNGSGSLFYMTISPRKNGSGGLKLLNFSQYFECSLTPIMWTSCGSERKSGHRHRHIEGMVIEHQVNRIWVKLYFFRFSVFLDLEGAAPRQKLHSEYLHY